MKMRRVGGGRRRLWRRHGQVYLAHLRHGIKMYRRNDMKKRERHGEFDAGARVVVNETAPGGYRARVGAVLEIVLGSRYGISFDNQHEPTVYLDSKCLDPAPQVRTT